MRNLTTSRGIISARAETDPNAALIALNQAFKQFRDKNDEERADMRAALDAQARALAAIQINGTSNSASPLSVATPVMSALAEFMKTGSTDGMSKLAPNAAMSTTSNPDGGYMIQPEIDRMIQSQMVALSPMRSVADVKRSTSGDWKRIINRRGASSGWVGETETRTGTESPHLAQVTPPMGELYALPEVTKWMLDDASFDLGEFLQENVADEMALQEGAAFTHGDGIKKPFGFLSKQVSTEADGVRSFEKLQYVGTGVAAALTDETHNGGDALVDLVYSVRAPYRAGPGVGFQMNSATIAIVSKLKDGQGNYLWQPSAQAGEPSTLLGFPVFANEEMPDIAANAFPIAFGNWRRGYVIVDRSEMSVLRDPYTKKGFVIFYFVKRVGGSVSDSNAIKLLKVEA